MSERVVGFVREVFDQAVMRGFPRPILATLCALLLMASVIGLIAGVVLAFVILILLMESDIPLFIALVMVVVVACLALEIYRHLPADPRKSKTEDE